jgi:hypothetical protein
MSVISLGIKVYNHKMKELAVWYMEVFENHFVIPR